MWIPKLKNDWVKYGRVKSGLVKNGRGKNGLGQKWPGQKRPGQKWLGSKMAIYRRQTRIESSSLKFVSDVVHMTFEHQKVSKTYTYQIIREESET